jgi:hypothetical protein
MNYLIAVVIFLTSETIAAQSCKCKHDVLARDVGYLKNFDSPDTVNQKVNSYSYIIYYIYDCFGTIKFEKYDTLGKLLTSGNFEGVKSLITKKVASTDLDGNFYKDVKVKRYEPLKEGLWLYYDANGTLKKEEVYSKDFLISINEF